MQILKKLKNYHFQIRHFIILFTVLVLFQTILSYINSTSTSNLLSKTMELYRRDSAENMADLTTTSLEMLLENSLLSRNQTEGSKRGTIRELNIILSLQTLRQNISEICILIPVKDKIHIISDGEALYSYFFNNTLPENINLAKNASAIEYYSENRKLIVQEEQIISKLDDSYIFHILVPFVPQGELRGAVYMKIAPDFTKIYNEITASYDETGAIFSALILLSILAMFYVGSYTLRERDNAQQLLFEERKIQLKREIEHQKEALFTQRIYHAHHKAEKVMGFIKTDLKSMLGKMNDTLINKMIKYTNFVSRVIYDMKSYEPPIDVIRNPLFKTDLNEVIRFLIDNIFLRVYKYGKGPRFKLELSPGLSTVSINEYIVWEIIEPLIKNSIDHNPGKQVLITVKTYFDPRAEAIIIKIIDNGTGIKAELLETDNNGVKRIFLEHTTTKINSHNSGYGCYLAYEISKKRCGWMLDAQNNILSGACFTITIPTRT